MGTTFTQSDVSTFTITNARYIGSKVKTDLMRFNRYYFDSHGEPSISHIEDLHNEFVLLLVYNLLNEIEYGFKKDNCWVKALKYSSRENGVMAGNDDPGGVEFSTVPRDARFSSVLTYNEHSHRYAEDKRKFLLETPINRVSGNEISGDWNQQRSYSSGGRGVLRSGI